MGKADTTDLMTFLMPYPTSVANTALWLRNFIWDIYPESNELIYDNYNALAVGFSPTDKAGDVFCSFAVYSKYLNLGFNRGSELHDPQQLLSGDGSLYRYITLKNIDDLPQAYIISMMYDAYLNSVQRLKKQTKEIKGLTIVKSISTTKRRPLY